MSENKKLKFVRGYEVSGVSPLPHYFEEIYGNTKGIKSIGPRGDSHYFWHSKDGNGAAYYEVSEQKKSAESTYDFFASKKNIQKYLKGIEVVVEQVRSWVDFVSNLDLKNLDTPDVLDCLDKGWTLYAKVFSYYLISQPYRLQLLEDELRDELKRKVAKTRIDYYISKLTASEKVTISTLEELDWAKLILSYKDRVKNITALNLNDHPDLKNKILTHYNKYKTLTLGDGSWEFNPEDEIKRFVEELKKPKDYFEERVDTINSTPRKILSDRKRLEKELSLNPRALEIIDFLAEISHIRYSLRIEGFIPLIYANIKPSDEAAIRLNYVDFGDVMYQTPDEMSNTVKLAKQTVPEAEIKRRRGKDDEYLIELNNSKVRYYYGSDAAKRFLELVPKVDYESVEEVEGTSAENGIVQAGATVYSWGDDMKTTMNNIKKYPILIAGQTRPAMMSIIREAKGIITDEGGVTSHAAIIARELKIPTIINTHNATKVFKTGDNILLDADNGTAKKLK